MDVLAEKFEIYRAEVLSGLEVSEAFLKLMIEVKLINTEESMRYMVMTDKQHQNMELMTAMTQCRTDQAYPVLLDCLRRTGQDAVADLLTDLTQKVLVGAGREAKNGEGDANTSSKEFPQTLTHKDNSTQTSLLPDTNGITNVHHKLDTALRDISAFMSREERRIGLMTITHTPKSRDTVSKAVLDTSDAFNNSGDRDLQQTAGQSVDETMTNAIHQIRRCQDVVNKLHSDCQAVAYINSDVMAEVKQCAVMIRETLKIHKLSVIEVPVPQKTTELFKVLMVDINTLTEWGRRALVREKEMRAQSMRLLRKCRDWLEERCQILNDVHSKTVPRASRKFPQTSTGFSINTPVTTSYMTSPASSRQSDHLKLDGNSSIKIGYSSPIRSVDPRPIMSVVNGLNLLESRIREYVHLEILLTDKFRSEQRIKHLQKRAHGYNSKGFQHLEHLLERIEQRVDMDENVARIKGTIAKLTAEYEECVHYLKRVTKVMPKTYDVVPMESSQRSSLEIKSRSMFRFFKKLKEDPKGSGVHLPRILVPGGTIAQFEVEPAVPHGKPLLSRLKILVSNYEATKNNEKLIIDKFCSDRDRRMKELTIVMRKKEEKAVKLQFRLNEVAADRDKYRRLYEQMKMTDGRKG